MTHAIVARQAGGPEVLEYQDVERPTPGSGQLLIKVGAAGVNFIDTYKRSGAYQVPYPFTPGSEAAGTVESVGAGVKDFTAGDRIATAEGIACYAGYALVPEEAALPVPDGVDDLTAAALPLQGITAHYLMNSTFKVAAGHTVLLHAGAGGVGLLLIQLLKARGARVITTVSSDAKAELAAGAGADHVLRYDGFADKVRDITGGTGADVVYDGVGKDTFDGSLAALRIRGTLVLFGAASGPVPAVDPQRLNAGGSLFLTRPTMAHYLQDAAERRWRSGEVFAAAADGSLKVRIGAQYSLADAAQAHRDLEGRRTTGKVLLVP
ncbi:NADPH--quinone reductase [Arthrobacter sp. ZBG10]|uniref:quinone oxidoreductase family protein n=1 Tax=unclassified Arthrobacter TaxID=235627 RepID=UPI000681FDE0|nr:MULTISPECIES: quinone oxidoreductase [unclassified Arthrobacter]KNH17079.1 NADPH--quinone reductase [Arthrobacter sp. ZBG10]KQR03995.1 NADPH--quinone reductase [Arthrobacter sp. Leaf141]